MGKAANAPRIAENEAMAFGKMIRSSARKLNLVAELIRGKSAQAAVAASMISASVARAPGLSVTNALGRSPHLSSGMPMTAHSMTSSDSMIRFSTWAE